MAAEHVRIKAQLLKQDNAAGRRRTSLSGPEWPAAHTKRGPAVDTAREKTAGLSWMREESDAVSYEELLLLPYFSHELLLVVGLNIANIDTNVAIGSDQS